MRASRWRVYLNPFDDNGNYTGFVDVSDDVELDSLGTIDQSLDNTDYNIGIYRNADFQVTFRNDSGRYSDVGQPESMFRYTRSNTLFKLTWQGNGERPTCGFSEAGNTVMVPEVEIFTGLLSDKSVTMDLVTCELQFDILGRENVLSSIIVNNNDLHSFVETDFSITSASPAVVTVAGIPDLVVIPGTPFRFDNGGSGILTGVDETTTYYAMNPVFGGSTWTFNLASSYADAINSISPLGTSGSIPGTAATISMLTAPSAKDLIFNMVNKSQVTVLLTVSFANFSVGFDSTIDDTTPFENVTTWAALTDLLLVSNSVLFIKNGAIFVTPRDVNAIVALELNGPNSQIGFIAGTGAENIQDIQNITSGIARTFNYMSWTSAISANPDRVYENKQSEKFYGSIQKSFNQKFITNDNTKDLIMAELVGEFAFPKQEFDIYTPITYETLAYFLLDPVSVSYPASYAGDPEDFPICGTAICGSAVTPKAIFGFVESPFNTYKIEGSSIDPQSDLICFSVRLV